MGKRVLHGAPGSLYGGRRGEPGPLREYARRRHPGDALAHPRPAPPSMAPCRSAEPPCADPVPRDAVPDRASAPPCLAFSYQRSSGGGAYSSAGAGFVGLAEAVQDQAVQVQVEAVVRGVHELAGLERERALAPQQEAEDHPTQRLVDGALEIVLSHRAGGHQQTAEPLSGMPALLGERTLQGVAVDEPAVEQHLAGRDRGPGGAREHRPPTLDEQLRALPGALEHQPSGGLRELKELHHLGGKEVREIAAQRAGGFRLAHFAPWRTSPTTLPGARAAAPVMRRRLYQPSTSTWITVAASSTARAVTVSISRRSIRCPPRRPPSACRVRSIAISAVMTTPVRRPNRVG